MTKKLSVKEKTILKDIAKCYNCRIYFSKNKEKNYWNMNNSITISESNSFNFALNSIFHEIAHYKNFLEGKFKYYHNHTLSEKFLRRSYHLFVLYALRAEIFTDKIAQNLKRQWFKKYRLKQKYTYKDYSFLKDYYSL